MNWQFTPNSLLLFIASGISIALAIYAWQHRATPGGKSFALLLFLIAEWSFSYGVELGSTIQADKEFWAKLQYLGIAFTPAAWLYLSLQYASKDRMFSGKPKNLILLILGPTITFFLAFTNESHTLIWRTTELVFQGKQLHLSFTYGPWFWVHVLFSYGCLVVGFTALLRAYFHAQPLYKGQVGFLLIGALIPWLANALYLTKLNPIPNLDLTPFAFTVTGLVTAGGLFRFKFLNIVPIARETVIESMKDGIFVLDNDGRIVDLNPAAKTILNQPDGTSILGRPFSQVLPQYEQKSNQFANAGRGVSEIQIHKDDQTHFYEVQTALLTDQHHQPTGRLIVLHETTEHKQFETVLQRAKEEAETAVKTKTAFLANMSHEIRTPLNAVIGMAELLRNTSLTLEQQEFIETIYTSSDTLLNLINNILDFSKIETGNVKLEVEPFDLQDCLEVSLNLILPLINVHSVKLAYYIDEQTPSTFDGDVVRLRQILVNLLGNAAKFTDEGDISVHVTSEQLDQNKYRLHFAVKDTGIGISEDRIETLFESFTQADASTTRKYGGTGLGLAISKKLSQLMGGDIWVESKVGHGSTFHFTIQAPKSTRQPVRFLRPDQPRLRGKRLLIIADNADNRRLISRESRSWGMSPYVASTSEEALYWLRKSDPFDVTLIDQAVLELEGAGFIDQMKKCHQLPLPFVILKTDQTPLTQFSSIDFAATLEKPFAPAQLNNVLSGIFSTAKGATTKPHTTQITGVDMAQHHPLRILIAEDNRINQKVAMRILENLGYQPEIANNGLEVIDVLQSKQFDVILMDIQMPKMDGLETTRRILDEWPMDKRPFIVAMTAHALEGDRERYLANGLDDYISKPIQIENLVETLYRCNPVFVEPPGTIKDAGQTTSPTPIDIATLEDLLGSKATSLLDDLLPIFIDDAESTFSQMEQAITHGNSAQLKVAAHTLKGTSANLGMLTLASLCRKLENIDYLTAQERAHEIVVQISQEIEKIKIMVAANLANDLLASE